MRSELIEAVKASPGVEKAVPVTAGATIEQRVMSLLVQTSLSAPRWIC